MLLNKRSIGGVKLAVDVRGDQVIDGGATRHGRDSGAGGDQITSGVHAKYGTSRCRPECSTCRQFLRRKTLPRLVTRLPGEQRRAVRRPRPEVQASTYPS